jgi:hypothetical protein
MPRFRFHLSAPDECFRDSIGTDVADLAAAHARAVQLARRVMTFGGLAGSEPDLHRWTVRVVDDCGRPVLTVIFPLTFVTERSVSVQGARALIRRLEEGFALSGLETTTSVSTSRPNLRFDYVRPAKRRWPPRPFCH